MGVVHYQPDSPMATQISDADSDPHAEMGTFPQGVHLASLPLGQAHHGHFLPLLPTPSVPVTTPESGEPWAFT